MEICPFTEIIGIDMKEHLKICPKWDEASIVIEKCKNCGIEKEKEDKDHYCLEALKDKVKN